MPNSRSLLLTLMLLGLAEGSAANLPDTGSIEELSALPGHSATARDVVQVLASRHYVRNQLDNRLSARVFDAYLKTLDPSRIFLLEKDLARFEIYRYLMDDSLKRGDLGPAFKIFNTYRERVIERLQQNLAALEEDFAQFDFSLEESLEEIPTIF